MYCLVYERRELLGQGGREMMNRRAFLISAYRAGGLAALISLGLGRKEIQAITAAERQFAMGDPVVAGSTGILGYNSIGSVTTDNISGNYSWGWRVQANASGSLLTAKLYTASSVSSAGFAKLAVYTSSAATPQSSDAFVAQSGVISLSPAAGWYASTFASGTVTNGSYYWLFVNVGPAYDWPKCAHNTTGTVYAMTNSGWYTTCPSTFAGLSFTNGALAPISAWAGIGQ